MIEEIKVVYDSAHGRFEKAYTVIDGVPQIITKSRKIEELLKNLKIQEGVDNLRSIDSSKYSLISPSKTKIIDGWDKEFEDKELDYVADNGLSLKKKNNFRSAKNLNLKDKIKKGAKATLLVAGAACILTTAGCGVKKLYDKFVAKNVKEQVTEIDNNDVIIEEINDISNYETYAEYYKDSKTDGLTKDFSKEVADLCQSLTITIDTEDGKKTVCPSPEMVSAWLLQYNGDEYTKQEKLAILNGKDYDVDSISANANKFSEYYYMHMLSASSSKEMVPLTFKNENTQKYYSKIYSILCQFKDSTDSKEKKELSNQLNELFENIYKNHSVNDGDMIAIINTTLPFCEISGLRITESVNLKYSGYSEISNSEEEDIVKRQDANTDVIKNGCDINSANVKDIRNLIANNEFEGISLEEVLQLMDKSLKLGNYSVYNDELYSILYQYVGEKYSNSYVTGNKTTQKVVKVNTIYENQEVYVGGDQVGDIMGGTDPAEIEKIKTNVENTSAVVTNPTSTPEDILKAGEAGLANATDPADKGYQQEVIDNAQDGINQNDTVKGIYDNAITTGKDGEGNNVTDATITQSENGLNSVTITTDEINDSNKDIIVTAPVIDDNGNNTGENENENIDITQTEDTSKDPNQTEDSINNRQEIEEDDEPEIEIVDVEDLYSARSMSLEDHEALVDAMIEAMASQVDVEENVNVYTK